MVVALGIWVVILPHLGVPGFWHLVITTLTGLTIVGVGLYLRATQLSGSARRSSHHPFVENNHEDGTHEHTHSQQVSG